MRTIKMTHATLIRTQIDSRGETNPSKFNAAWTSFLFRKTSLMMCSLVVF